MARSLLLLSLLKEAYDSEIVYSRRKTRTRRNHDSCIRWKDYVNVYGLSKDLIDLLEQELSSIMPSNKRQSGLHIRTKILCTLSFLASGSYQKMLSTDIRNDISQPSMSRAIHQVIDAICHPDMTKKYMKFPENALERQKLKDEFYKKFGIPNVIGCIDSTLVALVKPKDNEEEYLCCNGCHAKNVQLICDADFNIIHVDSSFGGASNDSFIWNNSKIKNYLEDLQNTEETNYLLGDSDYPLKPYLMTPILDAEDCTPEAHYNKLHATAHNTMEHTIQTLKARFRCLLGHKALHYRPDMVSKMVKACCVLHNICNKNGLHTPSLTTEDLEIEKKIVLQDPGVLVENTELQMGQTSRSTLVNTLWLSRT